MLQLGGKKQFGQKLETGKLVTPTVIDHQPPSTIIHPAGNSSALAADIFSH
jgi:hypothetical protein